VTAQNWLWLATIAFGAWNAWQNKSIQNAVLALKLDLVDRIGKCEGDIKALQARGHRD
jgi:hypothetical protein